MINLNNVKLLISAGRISQIPVTGNRHVVIAGRSNVGKSSFINCMLARKNFARVSGTPGKTATINFYDVDGKLTLVDLPGYGYAKVSREKSGQWGTLIDEYLKSCMDIGLIIQLIDIRHAPTELDMVMHDWILGSRRDFAVVCTKSDKLSLKESGENLNMISREMSLPQEIRPIAFSSVKKTGRDEVMELMRSYALQD